MQDIDPYTLHFAKPIIWALYLDKAHLLVGVPPQAQVWEAGHGQPIALAQYTTQGRQRRAA